MKINFRVWDKINNRMIKPKKFATVIPEIDTDCNGLSYALAICEIGIVGNICENPELLEGSR